MIFSKKGKIDYLSYISLFLEEETLEIFSPKKISFPGLFKKKKNYSD